MIQIKRVYDEPAATDGLRILVDRLWPRGVTKERAALDAWPKEIAPSPELRTWFNHEPERFNEFAVRYLSELSHNPALPDLRDILSQHKTVTLLYGATDTKINHAVVLQRFLEKDHEV